MSNQITKIIPQNFTLYKYFLWPNFCSLFLIGSFNALLLTSVFKTLKIFKLIIFKEIIGSKKLNKFQFISGMFQWNFHLINKDFSLKSLTNHQKKKSLHERSEVFVFGVYEEIVEILWHRSNWLQLSVWKFWLLIKKLSKNWTNVARSNSIAEMIVIRKVFLFQSNK